VKLGSFSHVNARVEAMLRSNLPEVDLHMIDIIKDRVLRPTDLLVPVLSAVRTGGLRTLATRRAALHGARRTPAFLRTVRRRLLRRMAERPYAFTFQTQSVFDASLPGTPHFIYTDHTHLTNLQYSSTRRDRLLPEEWIELERETYAHATTIFTMGSQVARSLIRDYGCPTDKVLVVGCGPNVDTPPISQLSAARYRDKRILFVGKEWHRKGGEALARAFSRVLESHPSAELVIVGCTPRLELPNCRVMGRVSLEEVGRQMSLATVFCMPSEREPFGLVFIEAMGYQLPIVATSVGAIPDLVLPGENGFLVGPGDVAALAQRLSQLIGDADMCERFGRNGRAIADSGYTWDRTASLICERIIDQVPMLRGEPSLDAVPA
jgi:glycosyltransferase involved in cell wall biosynthesis